MVHGRLWRLVPSLARAVRSLARGTFLRCPRCGEGRLSDGPFSIFTVHDRCPHCGVSFEPGRGEFTGAMMLGWGVVGMIALMGYFVLHAFLLVPFWVELAWFAFALLFPVLFYRNIKGAWIGLLHAGNDLQPAAYRSSGLREPR